MHVTGVLILLYLFSNKLKTFACAKSRRFLLESSTDSGYIEEIFFYKFTFFPGLLIVILTEFAVRKMLDPDMYSENGSGSRGVQF